MANLVLKPSTGAGNSVIVKDQGGGAVLTTADSGATIANATLTTPTIASMANCTFPAGHVIQTKFDVYKNESSSSLTDFNTPSNADFEVSITPTSETNKILVFTSWEAELQNESSGMACDFYRLISGGSANTYLLSTSNGGQGVGQARSMAGDGSFRTPVAYWYMDSPNTTSEIKYRPSTRRTHGSGLVYIGAGSTGENIILAQEIKV